MGVDEGGGKGAIGPVKLGGCGGIKAWLVWQHWAGGRQSVRQTPRGQQAPGGVKKSGAAGVGAHDGRLGRLATPVAVPCDPGTVVWDSVAALRACELW